MKTIESDVLTRLLVQVNGAIATLKHGTTVDLEVPCSEGLFRVGDFLIIDLQNQHVQSAFFGNSPVEKKP